MTNPPDDFDLDVTDHDSPWYATLCDNSVEQAQPADATPADYSDVIALLREAKRAQNESIALRAAAGVAQKRATRLSTAMNDVCRELETPPALRGAALRRTRELQNEACGLRSSATAQNRAARTLVRNALNALPD